MIRPLILALALTGCAAQNDYLFYGENGYKTMPGHAAVEAEAIADVEATACRAVTRLGHECRDDLFIVYTYPAWNGLSAIGGPLVGMPSRCEGIIGYSPKCAGILAHEVAHAYGVKDEDGANWVSHRVWWPSDFMHGLSKPTL